MRESLSQKPRLAGFPALCRWADDCGEEKHTSKQITWGDH